MSIIIFCSSFLCIVFFILSSIFKTLASVLEALKDSIILTAELIGAILVSIIILLICNAIVDYFLLGEIKELIIMIVLVVISVILVGLVIGLPMGIIAIPFSIVTMAIFKIILISLNETAYIFEKGYNCFVSIIDKRIEKC